MTPTHPYATHRKTQKNKIVCANYNVNQLNFN